MEKAIVILDGVSEGKTSFIEIAKQSGFWIWNLNHRNVLSMLTHKLGWDGERNKDFYMFIDEFSGIANKYFDFENWYVSTMVEKFNQSEKANVLIIHNCNKEIGLLLQESQGNCYNIFVVDFNSEQNNEYCKTLNCRQDNYQEQVIKVLNTITNKEKDNA